MLKQTIFRSARAAAALSSRSLVHKTPAARLPVAAAAAAAVSSSSAFRWYSSEAPKQDAAEAAKDGEAAKEAEDETSALKKKLETKEKEALEFKDRYLRSVADFRNLQDRTARDMKSARDFAIQKFAKDLIDSVDNLDRALTMVPETKRTVASTSEPTTTTTTISAAEYAQDLANLYEGLKMTESILVSTLAKHGLERFSPEGEKFNPNEHDATFMAPQPDKEDNSVFHVQQKGFKLNGRVLRAAKVGVVKNA